VATARLASILHGLANGQRAAAIALAQCRAASGWGASRSAPDGRRADARDRFGIESVTKTFVSALALQLAGERQLSFDDTVQQWLPGRVRDGDRITIRELMNHTSGLARGMPTEFPRCVSNHDLSFGRGRRSRMRT
jgi:D-alanyl-D-alanine carboxypeptidase